MPQVRLIGAEDHSTLELVLSYKIDSLQVVDSRVWGHVMSMCVALWVNVVLQLTIFCGTRTYDKL